MQREKLYNLQTVYLNEKKGFLLHIKDDLFTTSKIGRIEFSLFLKTKSRQLK